MTSDGAAGRFLPTLCSDGHEQMAIDTLLLESSRTTPVLRFYRWNGPWLSIGRHQKHWPSHWNDLANAGRLSLVRRPSGGRAVLHAGGLTYALIWPQAPRRRHEAYREACLWLIDGFQQLGVRLHFGDQPALDEGLNCFARSTAADLVDASGVKRIGSAQRWLHGRLLQHGEILLDPPAPLWKDVFGEAAPASAPASIPRAGLDRHLLKSMQRNWSPLRWQEQPLDEKERQALSLTRSDSDACMVSTTCGSITRPSG